jgi:two-component system chemotaxis response regulator CheY
MELTMPAMNGIDAMKEFLKIDRNANIIVCSAKVEQMAVVGDGKRREGFYR